jgi:hypothetical protein
LLQHSHLIYLITLIQPLVFLFCLMVLFHFKFFHSIIMVGFVFIFGIFVEYSFNFVIVQFDYDRFLLVSQNEYIIQGFWVALINCLTAIILSKFRWGFTFISPRIHRFRSEIESIQNKLYLSALIFIVSFSTIGLCVYLWNDMFLIVLSVTSTILAFVLRYSYKREFID